MDANSARQMGNRLKMQFFLQKNIYIGYDIKIYK